MFGSEANAANLETSTQYFVATCLQAKSKPTNTSAKTTTTTSTNATITTTRRSFLAQWLPLAVSGLQP